MELYLILTRVIKLSIQIWRTYFNELVQISKSDKIANVQSSCLFFVTQPLFQTACVKLFGGNIGGASVPIVPMPLIAQMHSHIHIGNTHSHTATTLRTCICCVYNANGLMACVATICCRVNHPVVTGLHTRKVRHSHAHFAPHHTSSALDLRVIALPVVTWTAMQPVLGVVVLFFKGADGWQLLKPESTIDSH